MPEAPIRSIDHVCEVLDLGDRRQAPSLLLEVPHGATRAVHFDEVRARLVGEFPADLAAFFFVNTDVGAPEVARRVAEIVAGTSRRRVLVVRSLVPRTFVDCNRVIDVDAAPRASAAGEVTPGLHVYVRAAADRALLLSRYVAYRSVASAAYAAVCGAGGQALMVHSFAPRSIDVPVDERIVARLRAEYQPERIGQWPLRSEVDLIAKAPDGRVMAAPALVEACQRELRTAGLSVDVCGTYTLHPQTLAHEFAAAYPERTLCLEIRRDLLVPEFTPFAEMLPDASKVERVAAALARACGVGVGRGA